MNFPISSKIKKNFIDHNFFKTILISQQKNNGNSFVNRNVHSFTKQSLQYLQKHYKNNAIL